MRVALFGVPGAQRNLGVGALRASAVAGILERDPAADVTVFDDGWGIRAGSGYVGETPAPITLAGARDSRRFHKRESYLNMRLSAVLGGLGNPGLARIDAADAVLDVSGGDSFSDIYGLGRFRTVTWPKRLALLRRRPLILLPQTYGPFTDAGCRAEAARIVRGASAAWARDPESYAALADLLGDALDPARHHSGVDLAFALAPRRPSLSDDLEEWLAAGPVAGLNLSGLLVADPGTFGLTADPLEFATRLSTRILDSGAKLLLVPHVHTPGAPDDDDEVSATLVASLAATYGDRVRLAPAGMDPHQTKWVIARTDWFCGMRMHATIAALSSGVPVTVVAYSKKARGVFVTVGQEHHVADARTLDTEALLAQAWADFGDRDRTRAELAVGLPPVLAAASAQLDRIVAAI